MTKELILPDLGEGIEGADVSEISVSIGDRVSSDDTVLVLESDKASMEIPAENNGTVKEILVSVGDTIKTGQALLKIESLEAEQKEQKDEPQEIKNSPKSEKEPTPSAAETIEHALSDVGAQNSVFASPGVRRLSRELGINLEIIKGTGDKGRITKG